MSLVSSPDAKRRVVAAKTGKLSRKRRCELVGLPRSSFYRRAKGESRLNLDLMRLIDEIYTDCPFYGSRQMRNALRERGYRVGRKRVRRLMLKMGLQAQCPKPNLSKPAKGHKTYPYLMRNLVVDGPNQAWCADITYVRLEGGFVYVFAIMDWYSRKGLAWEMSNTLDTAFCLRALYRAIGENGSPSKAFNTDQGCQFTSEAWTTVLQQYGIAISMDGRGRALDNAFVERLWRSYKYEEVYRREYRDIADAKAYARKWFDFYNHRRPHSAIGDVPPARRHANNQDAAA